MEPLAIVLIVIAVLVLLLFAGGYVANARRREADRHLAAAHAEDKGWERGTLEEAARRAFAERHGVQPRDLKLIQVVNRPGVDEDEAVFAGDGQELVLGRRGGEWVAR